MWFQSVIVSFLASVSVNVTGICGFGLSLFGFATLVSVLRLVSFNKCQSPWRLLCPGDTCIHVQVQTEEALLCRNPSHSV